MQWVESVLFVGGIILTGTGLLQWFGVLRAERDPAVITRTRRISAVVVALGLVALAAHAVIVRG